MYGSSSTAMVSPPLIPPAESGGPAVLMTNQQLNNGYNLPALS